MQWGLMKEYDVLYLLVVDGNYWVISIFELYCEFECVE